MKKKIIPLLLGIFIGIILSETCVYAATLYEATEVAYDNSSSGTSNVNVQNALDELYSLAEKNKNNRKYLFKDGTFIIEPSSNTFKISNKMLTNGDNTTSCKWSSLDNKIKIFVLKGKYRDIDGNITIASSGFTPIYKTTSVQTKWVNGEYHEVTFLAIGTDLSLTTTAYGTGQNQMQYSEIYYYEILDE